MNLDYSNTNALIASILIEELVRCGVSTFVISPGSRSAPLTIAAARHDRTTRIVHPDERGAAFFALGHARATGQPVGLICTSGTAAANYLPAVVEASMDMVPLVLLTADRPPELRDCGANQTIHQVGLYNKFVRHSTDLPCPQVDIPAVLWLTTVDRAVASALGSPPGPVHINCPFREPLAPLMDGNDHSDMTTPLVRWMGSGEPYTAVQHAVVQPEQRQVDDLVETVKRSSSGLVIAGHLRTDGEKWAVKQVAQTLGWPLLPDIRSRLRLHDDIPGSLLYYDLQLQTGDFQQQFRPDTVLQFGTRLTSRRLLQYLEELAPRQYLLVDADPRRHDPAHRVTSRVVSDIAIFCTRFLAAIDSRREAPSPRFDQLTQNIAAILDEELTDRSELTEPLIARLLSRYMRDGGNLFLASSNAIRLLDTYGTPGSQACVASNRGASGIDGTIASAAGYTLGSGRRTTVLIGDLALLHDLNSLSLLNRAGKPVTIVILNNNGGGIFDSLPVSRCVDVYEDYFVAPHGLTFAHAAEMFGLEYTRVETADDFLDRYQQAVQASDSRLIEVPVPRRESRAAYKSILEKMRAVAVR
jgi:2-succinyl-5-enolpyruvyl-6-hydroxy-3-cyclohexene-1-carboxylate synthase